MTQQSVNYDADVKRRLINVDAAYRESSGVATGGAGAFGSTVTDFLFKLTTPVRNVARMEVKSVEIAGVTFGGTYALLQINDESSIESKSTGGTELRAVAKVLKRPLPGTSDNYLLGDTFGLISNVVAFRNPKDIAVLRVRLVNPDGTVMTPGSGTVAFTLELTEVVNSYLYESQRKHIGFDPANVRA